MLSKIILWIVTFLCETLVYSVSAFCEFVYHVGKLYGIIINQPRYVLWGDHGLREASEINATYEARKEKL